MEKISDTLLHRRRRTQSSIPGSHVSEEDFADLLSRSVSAEAEAEEMNFDLVEARKPTKYEVNNMVNSYKGQVYSGMIVGRSHIWNYDWGWKEERDLYYRTAKRRARTP